jgi:hypothetical protein
VPSVALGSRLDDNKSKRHSRADQEDHVCHIHQPLGPTFELSRRRRLAGGLSARRKGSGVTAVLATLQAAAIPVLRSSGARILSSTIDMRRIGSTGCLTWP